MANSLVETEGGWLTGGSGARAADSAAEISSLISTLTAFSVSPEGNGHEGQEASLERSSSDMLTEVARSAQHRLH